MRSLFLNLLFILSITSSFAQITYEEGYFVSNTGEITKCLIKNREWKNNPTEFEYKTSETSESLTASFDQVQEFAISNGPKYQRFSVQVDHSNTELDHLSHSRNPEFKKETVFLKVVTEGKATLFSYESPKFYYFFYRVDNDSVRQLIFKKYQTQNNQVGVNQLYKEQLLAALKCEGIKRSDVVGAKYFVKPLTSLFIKYNTCSDPSFKVVKSKTQDRFNLSLRPGVNFGSVLIENSVINVFTPYSVQFDRKPGFRLGLEAEFILPFNKNKWSVVLEPTFQSYSNTKDDVSITYNSLELPVGLRYYIFLNDNSKLFLNGLALFDFSNGSMIEFENREDLKLVNGPGLAAGLGYNLKKYSVEMRYYFNRAILNNYTNWEGKYNSISFIVGYKFL